MDKQALRIGIFSDAADPQSVVGQFAHRARGVTHLLGT
jgi:hypothetical protein